MKLKKKENSVCATFFKILCLLIYIFLIYIPGGEVHLNIIYVDIWEFNIFIFLRKEIYNLYISQAFIFL